MVTTVMPWLVESDQGSFAALQRHVAHVTHVSPTWYEIDADLKITSHEDGKVTAFARDHHFKLLPLIRNTGFDAHIALQLLESADRRSALADKIAQLVLDRTYDGINVDFEGSFGDGRDGFTDFVARLAERLRPAGKLVTVDVVAQTHAASLYHASSWASCYDYRALGALVDKLVIMVYDYATSSPGPISPLWWLQDVLSYTFGQVPRAKVIVGLPFYGRHWTTNGGQKSPAEGLKQSQALSLLTRSGAQVDRPERDSTPRFSWTDTDGDHVVHFEDAQSLTAKLQRALGLGATGFAFWRLGQEADSQWDVIASAIPSAPV